MLTYETEGTEWARASDGSEVTLPYKPARVGKYWAVTYFDEVECVDTDMTGGQAAAWADALNEAYMKGFEIAIECNG